MASVNLRLSGVFHNPKFSGEGEVTGGERIATALFELFGEGSGTLKYLARLSFNYGSGRRENENYA